MADWKATLTLNGAQYVYPAGPMLPNHFIDRVDDGIYLVRRGDAMLDVHVAAEAAQVFHLGPHHVTLVENGVTLFDEDLLAHYWNGKFAIRAALPTPKKTPKDLFDLKLLPIYGNTGNHVGEVRYVKVTVPFGASNVTVYMPTTGERSDIGMITDVAAAFALSGNWQGLLAWAMAAGAFCIDWRDIKGNAGLSPDILKYPDINAYDQPDKQRFTEKIAKYIIKGPPNAAGNFEYGNGTTPQNAHWCDMSYVASVVFEDPVFLLDTQQAFIFNLGGSAELCTTDGRRVQAGEYRGVAHGEGMGFKAYAATKDFERRSALNPAIHMPASYLAKLMEGSRDYYAAAMLIPDCARFNVFPQGETFFAPWQHEYLTMDLLEGVLVGFADWVPHCMFALANLVWRFSGKSGYPPAYQGYYLNLADGHSVAFKTPEEVFDNIAINGNFVVLPLPAAQYAALKADPMNGGVPIGTTEYLMTSHACFAFASYLETLGLLSPHDIPYFDDAKANCNTLFKSLGSVNPRVSVVEKYDPEDLVHVSVIEGLDTPAPVEPGQPAPVPLDYGTDKPGPDLDPKSFAFESPTMGRDAVTSLGELFLNVAGQVPGGVHQIIANIKGNGATKVWLQQDLPSDWFAQAPDSPGGAVAISDQHGTGDIVYLTGCIALTINGKLVWQAPDTTTLPIPSTPAAKDIHMGQPFHINVGQHIHLPITWDADGAPAQKPSNITYKATPADAVTLTPDDTGVDVLGLKSGQVTVEVDAIGDGALSGTDQGTVDLPLAKAIHLNA